LKKQAHQPVCHNRSLEDFLIMPVQRLPRYVLLLKELAKHTEPGHPDEANIKEAIEKIQGVLAFLNDSKKKVDHLEKISGIIQRVVDLDQSMVIERHHVFDGPIVLFGSRDQPNQEASGANPLERLWSLIGKEEIYVYLFEDMMLCAKKIKKATDSKGLFANKFIAYKYNVMKIVPLFGEKCATRVKDPENAFKIDADPSHLYICPSPQLREIWVTKINTRTAKRT